MLHLIAKLDIDCESESLDCYTVYLNDSADESIDFWFPKRERPTTMDLHVEFDRGDDSGDHAASERRIRCE